MSRRFVVAGVIAVALVPGCKKKAQEVAPPPPSPVATVADAGGAAPATAPDPDFERRREELLRRGDPAMMKPAPVVDGSQAPPQNPADLIKPLGKDVMMVGAIKVDLARGTAEVPAKAAAPVGPLEYVAVAEAGGKSYESLLTIATTAVELRLALTLLGYEGTPPGADGQVPRATDADSVKVSLVIDGKARGLGALMIDQKTGKAPPDVPWQVVGFADADRAGALATTNFLTLVDRDVQAPLRRSVDAGNPYAQGQGLVANPKVLPIVGTPMTLVITRGPGAPAAPTPPTSAAP